MSVTVQRLVELPADGLADLVTESEGFQLRLVRRLVDEWIAGANRFDRPGEAFFAAAINGRVIGVCGLNVDAYTTEPRIGRVRHLYVLLEHRRRGIGTRLVHEVIAAARGTFDRLRLRTNNLQAAAFYEELGFQPTSGDPDCTHVLQLSAVRDSDAIS
jgi:GNAT superfamily N-acetyltransferase